MSARCELETVAVVGASGFVGRHLCSYLADRGIPVRALVRRQEAQVSGTKVVVENFRDTEALRAGIAGSTRIVHLADEAGRLAPVDNMLPIAHTLAAAVEDRAVRLVYASSIYARLSAEGETNAYGERKREQERILGGVHQAIGLRLPPVYGPGSGGSYALLERTVARGLPLPFGLATQPRSYLSIHSLVTLVEAMLGAPDEPWCEAAGKVYEPDDGVRVSTRDLTLRLARTHGLKGKVVPVPRFALAIAARIVGKDALVSGAFDPLEARDTAELGRLFAWRPLTVGPL